MSFILDALRKAEHRNRDNHEMSVPTGPRVLLDETPEPPTNWRNIIVLGICGLALLSAGVIFGLRDNPAPVFDGSATADFTTADAVSNNAGALMPGSAPAPLSGGPVRTTGDTPLSTAPTATEYPVGARDTGARALDREAARTMEQQTVKPLPRAATATSKSTANSAPAPARARIQNEALPEYLAIIQSGQVALPQLHLDMHVYSVTPEKRLVFVNLNKFRAGDKVDANTTIESIEPDGVIIDHKGLRFMLRPD